MSLKLGRRVHGNSERSCVHGTTNTFLWSSRVNFDALDKTISQRDLIACVGEDAYSVSYI